MEEKRSKAQFCKLNGSCSITHAQNPAENHTCYDFVIRKSTSLKAENAPFFKKLMQCLFVIGNLRSRGKLEIRYISLFLAKTCSIKC
jgi:hypothetical protein